MVFISVRDLRSRSSLVWRRLSRERELVVTSNGRPIAILSAVTEQTLEESLAAIRRARAMEAVAALQRESARRGAARISRQEIEAELRAVRRKRRS